jgi:hypothetical protein
MAGKARPCSSCTRLLEHDDIVFSSPYPEEVITRTGSKRKGTLADAERVWCGGDCAQATYELQQMGLA